MGYPNLSSLTVCVRASPASRNEELSDARHSNRSGPQAGEISPRTRRRRRLAPSARLHRLQLRPRPPRRPGAGSGTAKGRVAAKAGRLVPAMVTPVAPSTSNINDRLQCRRHLKAEESGATAGTQDFDGRLGWSRQASFLAWAGSLA